MSSTAVLKMTILRIIPRFQNPEIVTRSHEKIEKTQNSSKTHVVFRHYNEFHESNKMGIPDKTRFPDFTTMEISLQSAIFIDSLKDCFL